MIGVLVTLVVLIVILALVYWVLHQIAGAFGLPPQIVVVLDVVLVVIAILLLLSLLAGSGPVPRIPIR